MKKTVILFSLILMTSLLSCEKNDYKTEIFNDNFKIIYGDWKNVSPIHRCIIQVPSDTVCFDKLIIKKIGKFDVYTNDGLDYSGKIEIKTQTEDKLIVEFNPPGVFLGNSRSIQFQGNDTLIINIHCIDCLCCNYIFAKIK